MKTKLLLGRLFTSCLRAARLGLVAAISMPHFCSAGIVIVPPEIRVTVNDVDLVDGVDSVNFGSVTIGSPVTRSFVILNTSEGDSLSGISVSIDGADSDRFEVTVAPASSVGPNSTTTLTVRFSPNLAAMRSATLHIESNDSDESPFDILLLGTGTAPVPTGPPPTSDAVTLANGPSRIEPLANDSDPNVTITSVVGAGVAISADGRSLHIPAGLMGNVSYTTSAGWSSNVTILSGMPIAAPTKWHGLLRDNGGEIVGQFTAKQTKGRYSASINIGHVKKAAKFVPGTPVTTQFGALNVTLDGAGHLQVVLGTNTGDARPLFATATTRKYVTELASIDPLLLGGGYGNVSVKKTGATSVAGVLPDGTKFSAATGLADNFSLAVFAPVKGTKPKGTVAGQFTFAPISATDVTGELAWVKPPQTKGLLASGVDTVLTVNGSILAANFGPTGSITGSFKGANFGAMDTLFTPLTLGKGVPTATLKKLIINGRTGGVVGTVVDPVTTKPIPFKGVYLPKSRRVWGFLKSATTPGRIQAGVILVN
jgi:hypothetical protein